MTPPSNQLLRILPIFQVLAGIVVCAGLFAHQSNEAVIFHRYSRGLFAYLVIVVGCWVGTLFATHAIARGRVGHAHRQTSLAAVWLGLVAIAVAHLPELSRGVRFAFVALIASWMGALWISAFRRMSRLPAADRASVQLLGGLGAALLLLGAGGWLQPGMSTGWSWVFAEAGLALAALALHASRPTRLGILGSVLLAGFLLTVAEVAFRVLDVYGERAGTYIAEETDVAFHHNYEPGATFTRYPDQYDDFSPILNEVNSLGMRGPEPARLPSGTLAPADVLLLGDSFIQATAVAWPDALGQVLQKKVRARGRPDFSVVSHGMSSWSPLTEWNWYLKVGRKFAPKQVWLFLFYNDFLPVSAYDRCDDAYLQQVVMDVNGRPDHFVFSRSRPAVLSVYPFLDRLQLVRLGRLAFVRWQQRAAAASPRPKPSPAPLASLAPPAGHDGELAPLFASLGREMGTDPAPLDQRALDELMTLPWPEFNARIHPRMSRAFWASQRPLRLWSDEQLRAIDRSEMILRRFAEDVARDGAKLTLVYIPQPYQVGPRETAVGRFIERIGQTVVSPEVSGVQEWIAKAGNEIGVEVWDPTAAFRERDRQAPPSAPRLYLRADGHWNAHGQEFMAEWLAHRLVGSGS